MQLSSHNFLSAIKSIIMGGGLDSANNPIGTTGGFFRDIPVPLSALDLATVINYDGSEVGAAIATLSGAYLAASDETNARVVKVDEDIDDIGWLTIPVPRDYDEATDTLLIRVLADVISTATDGDVQLWNETFIKPADGGALGSDLTIDEPGTVLTTVAQWVEFDFTGNDLVRDDVINFNLTTNTLNDTAGSEIQVHAVEVSYRSTLVSYDNCDSSGNDLR